MFLCANGFKQINIVMDSEPNALPEWVQSEQSKLSISNQYLDFVNNVETLAHPYDTKIIWTSFLESKIYKLDDRTLLNHLWDYIGYSTFLDYRNSATNPAEDNILSHYLEALDQTPHGSKLSISVETNPDVEPAKITFGVLNEHAMEQAFNQTFNVVGTDPRFAGFVVHDTINYMLLTKNDVAKRCKDVWLWNTDYILERNGKTRAQLFAFYNQQGVQRIYAESFFAFTDLREQWKSFIRDAYAHGFAVDLMFGNYEWIYTQNHQDGLDKIEEALVFVQEMENEHLTLNLNTDCIGNVDVSPTPTPIYSPSHSPSVSNIPSHSFTNIPTPTSHVSVSPSPIPIVFGNLLCQCQIVSGPSPTPSPILNPSPSSSFVPSSSSNPSVSSTPSSTPSVNPSASSSPQQSSSGDFIVAKNYHIEVDTKYSNYQPHDCCCGSANNRGDDWCASKGLGWCKNPRTFCVYGNCMQGSYGHCSSQACDFLAHPEDNNCSPPGEPPAFFLPFPELSVKDPSKDWCCNLGGSNNRCSYPPVQGSYEEGCRRLRILDRKGNSAGWFPGLDY